ncbi:7-carboxy-7-deazaguanine synthase QueE [Pseudomonadota bacterium]
MTDKASDDSQNKLRINEIFYSLQGEARTVGIPTVFVRLTGCPLRCQYCDTAYAFQGGEWQTFDEIVNEILQYETAFVTVSGGEPLAQPACIDLLTLLCDKGFDVSLETSGALDVGQVDRRVSKVMDIKTPGSGEQERNCFENIEHLTKHDQVKFVICDRNDYMWAKELIIRYELAEICEVLISPSYGQVDLRELADWILEDRLPVRFQTQMHKMLWGDGPGH